MDALQLVGLPALMALTHGRSDVVIGLVDGPVEVNHPDLASGKIRTVAGTSAACRDRSSEACGHGTFVAGVLIARRGEEAPGIAPGCALLVRPVFSELSPTRDLVGATLGQVAEAVIDCVDAGAWIVNLSGALIQGSIGTQRHLEEALGYAARRGVLVVVAAGNHGTVGGSIITRHPWTIPVVAYELSGRPLAGSNLGRSMGGRGIGAPGEGVVSWAPEGGPVTAAGTSVAAAFVTGAAALLWSAFPSATAVEVKHALLSAPVGRRNTIIPPLLDAWRAYRVLLEIRKGRAMP
jgi:subtilisin family serine protease